MFFSSSWACDSTSAIVELKALFWVAKLAEYHGWEVIEWRSDSQGIVNQILSLEDPCGWESRHTILSLRHLFFSHLGWNLCLIPRFANRCADIAAKWARVERCNVAIADGFECLIPFLVLNILVEEGT